VYLLLLLGKPVNCAKATQKRATRAGFPTVSQLHQPLKAKASPTAVCELRRRTLGSALPSEENQTGNNDLTKYSFQRKKFKAVKRLGRLFLKKLRGLTKLLEGKKRSSGWGTLPAHSPQPQYPETMLAQGSSGTQSRGQQSLTAPQPQSWFQHSGCRTRCRAPHMPGRPPHQRENQFTYLTGFYPERGQYLCCPRNFLSFQKCQER